MDVLNLSRSRERAPGNGTPTHSSTKRSRCTSLPEIPSTTKPRFPDSVASGSAPRVLQRSPDSTTNATVMYKRPKISEASTHVRHRFSSALSSEVRIDESTLLQQQSLSTDKSARSSGFSPTSPIDLISPGPLSESPMPLADDKSSTASESTQPLASETEPCEGNSLPTTPEPALESPLHSTGPKARPTSPNSTPSFRPLYLEQRSVLAITHTVFNLMQKPLSDRRDLDKGHIYTLRLPDCPGYIKIGRTKNPIQKRIDQINACIPATLQAINDDDRCRVPNHTKVEALIHRELRNYRCYFPCNCKKKSNLRNHDCEGFGGETKHGEWFKIDEVKAREVVGRWRTWMSSKPYCDGILRPTEKMRIEDYAENIDRMKGMITADDKDWRWDKFMRFSRLRLCFIWLRSMLHEERHKGRRAKFTRSRWDSLRTDWQANLLFYFTFFVFSLMISVVSSLLPSTMGFVPVFPLINSVTLGSWAILYAA